MTIREAVPVTVASLSALVLCFSSSEARAADTDVRVDSIGYPSAAHKLATVASGSTTYAVHKAGDGSVVAMGNVSAAITDADTSAQVFRVDFSSVTAAGRYYLEVPGVGQSVDFDIGDDVYRAAFNASMLGFYGWRCGTAVSLSYGGTTFSHAPCHTKDGLLDYVATALGTTAPSRDGTKGWHDAGDYGKYTGNGAFAVGMMLRAWEMHPKALAMVELAIPETGGPVPDYLAEIRWELEWLLTMQYSATDGRVSHKLTSLAFDPFEMPEVDLLDRYFVPFGSAATADFAAAMAEASRVYAPYDAAFSAKCLAAAKLAYAWLVANTANVAANQTGFSTGGYTTTDADDRYWAAAEIWDTTGDAAALMDFETRANTYRAGRTGAVDNDFDWGNVRNLGSITYALSKRAGANATTQSGVATGIVNAANALVTASRTSAWGRAVGYYWGANGGVARACMLLDAARTLAATTAVQVDLPSLLDACQDQLAHLFGRNQWARSQVTGLGVNPPLFPHHRPSGADGIDAPWPGLLVGGAQIGALTDPSPPLDQTTMMPQPRNWVDEQPRYWVNEVAINWNAPLVYALGVFLSESPGAGTTTSSTGGTTATTATSGATATGGAASSSTSAGASSTGSTGGGASGGATASSGVSTTSTADTSSGAGSTSSATSAVATVTGSGSSSGTANGTTAATVGVPAPAAHGGCACRTERASRRTQREPLGVVLFTIAIASLAARRGRQLRNQFSKRRLGTRTK